MARAKKETAGTEVVKARVTTKDKARRYIERISKRQVMPLVFEAVLTAYAAIGVLKYEEVMEMSDSYSSTYINGSEEMKGE